MADVETRNILTLHKKANLEPQQVWLFDAYKKMISQINKKATNPNSSIDPFASKYMGKDSAKIDLNCYNALLEITSYFWASKAGRGKILEKTISMLAGDQADQDVYLSNFLNKLLESSGMNEGNVSTKFKKKYDLINRLGDTLVIFEIKNRIDSGGTSGRRDAMKKFVEMCNNMENNTIALSYDGKEYTLPQLLKKIGINRVEMLLGLFYNIKGDEAKIQDDKNGGFYSESKKLIDDYRNTHFSVGGDSETLLIEFEKDEVKFIIQTVYGSDSTKRFGGNSLTLKKVLGKVFPKSWDDIWLALHTGIEQRRILLEYGQNYIMEIQRINETDSDFKKELKKFKQDHTDIIQLKKMVGLIKKNAKLKKDNSTDQDIADCLYLCAGCIR